MDEFSRSLVAGIVSGGVMSTVLGFLFQQRATKIEEQIKSQFERSMAIFQSTRAWKEKSVSELLGPIYMQFDRTRRAFGRWTSKNLFLESKIIKEGNLIIRDLLLTKGNLIPPQLLEDAGKLVEHYDRWLEEFEQLRSTENPKSDTPFTFVGPAGFPFPEESEKKFREAFRMLWNDLYSVPSSSTSGVLQD